VADLPDVNVWLALTVPEHQHHAQAVRYWHDESGEQLAFCRVTALVFLRLLSSAAVMDGKPLRPAEAWSTYRDWLGRASIAFVREPAGCDAYLARWAGGDVITPRLWTDAYLAAFARSAGMRLVTFDRDFRRFDGLNLIELE
jgi:toxin-antitoxin system PIN domain toxin